MTELVSYSILGLVQGLTEFLPVSSSGHLILARELLGVSSATSLAEDAVLQLATTGAVIIYFWRDLLGLLRFGREERWLIGLLVMGTIPAVIFGLLLEGTMASAFRSPALVAYMLIVGSGIFMVAEWVSGQYKTTKLMHSLTFVNALLIGLFQSLALVPGLSRSGMTISGGLMLGLSRTDAARFGFLLSIPILLGSGAKKLLELSDPAVTSTVGPELIIASAVALASGLVAVHALIQLLKYMPLSWFAAYRVALAAAILLVVYI